MMTAKEINQQVPLLIVATERLVRFWKLGDIPSIIELSNAIRDLAHDMGTLATIATAEHLVLVEDTNNLK